MGIPSRLELANIEPRNITVIVGADFPDALIQLDIKKDEEGQPLVTDPFWMHHLCK